MKFEQKQFIIVAYSTYIIACQCWLVPIFSLQYKSKDLVVLGLVPFLACGQSEASRW